MFVKMYYAIWSDINSDKEDINVVQSLYLHV